MSLCEFPMGLIKFYFLFGWTGCWSHVPASCCGSRDTHMCVYVCWQWPSIRTGYTREPDMDLTPQTDVLAGTEPLREQSDSHVPSRQTEDRHHWGKDRWLRQVDWKIDWLSDRQTDRSHSPGSSLHWLPVEDLDRTTGPWVDLVVHHVFQTLVIGRTDEDLWRQLPPREPIIQNLITDQ